MQPFFGSAWKAIFRISILCFLNLCMAGLQWTLFYLLGWDLPAHFLQTEPDLKLNPWQRRPGVAEGCPRCWPQDHSAIVPAVCQNPRCPSGLLVFIIAKWELYLSPAVSLEELDLLGPLKHGKAACLGDPVELRDLRGARWLMGQGGF